jgi:hypothetical protein
VNPHGNRIGTPTLRLDDFGQSCFRCVDSEEAGGTRKAAVVEYHHLDLADAHPVGGNRRGGCRFLSCNGRY